MSIVDYKVVCDESNNTTEIINQNELIATIYLKPPPIYVLDFTIDIDGNVTWGSK